MRKTNLILTLVALLVCIVAFSACESARGQTAVTPANTAKQLIHSAVPATAPFITAAIDTNRISRFVFDTRFETRDFAPDIALLNFGRDDRRSLIRHQVFYPDDDAKQPVASKYSKEPERTRRFYGFSPDNYARARV